MFGFLEADRWRLRVYYFLGHARDVSVSALAWARDATLSVTLGSMQPSFSTKVVRRSHGKSTKDAFTHQVVESNKLSTTDVVDELWF